MKKEHSYSPYIIGGIVIAVFLVYVIQLLYIQTIQKQYRDYASSNVLRFVTQYPTRGLIFDRKNRLLVYNEPVYDIMVVPRRYSHLIVPDYAKCLKLPGIPGITVKYGKNTVVLKPSIF